MGRAGADCSNMSARTRLLGLVVCVVLGAGCGGTSSTATTSTSPSPSALFVTADAENLILQPGDVGSGWFAVAKDTHAVSLAESMKGDSASRRKIEHFGHRASASQAFRIAAAQDARLTAA